MIDICYVGNSSNDIIVVNDKKYNTLGGSSIYSSFSSRTSFDGKIGVISKVDGWLNGDNGDYGNWKEAKVLVSTEITTPLRYRSNSYNHNFFTEGSMDIICDDKRIDRRDEVTVTFKTYSTAEVEYLGQREVWEY